MPILLANIHCATYINNEQYTAAGGEVLHLRREQKRELCFLGTTSRDMSVAGGW